MIFGVYSSFLRFFSPGLRLYLTLRRNRGKEDAARAGERRGQAAFARPSGGLVWIHAASVGESLSILPLVEALLAAHAGLHVLVTTGTVTSARLMAARLPARAFHQYVPVDHPGWVARFLDHWKPGLVLWTESELWPNLLLQIKARGIPAVLLNARMSQKSFGRWQWLPRVASRLMSVFDLCFAQSDAEATRLKVLGARDVRVAGNLKYAAAPLPCDSVTLEAMEKRLAAASGTLADDITVPRLLWVSTHPTEETRALDLHRRLAARGMKNLLTVIAPRHPARGAAIMAELQAAAASPDVSAPDIRLRSRGDDVPLAAEIPAAGTIYIADTLGELGLFCRLSPVTVMGGSFADYGGHNPIEPAQLGSVVIFGPSRRNFLTIFDEFMTAGAMIAVDDEEQLAEAAMQALTSPDRRKAIAANARALCRDKAGVVEAVAAACDPIIRAMATADEVSS